jgi:hypothetical protein
MKHTQLFCTAALLCIFALKAGGQSTATLSGTVTDPTGAVVANAHVTVRSLATRVDPVIETDSGGLFAVPSVRRCLRYSESSKLRPTIGQCAVMDLRPDIVN